MPERTITKRVCQTCGAQFSTPEGRQGHTRATGHDQFKSKKIKVNVAPDRISYQPGYGPKE